MKSSPVSQAADFHNVPALIWLEPSRFTLGLAFGLFSVSNKLGHSCVLEWAAIRLPGFTHLSLGHAPADSSLELRADLPIEI
jgi:hypothetical protein